VTLGDDLRNPALVAWGKHRCCIYRNRSYLKLMSIDIFQVNRPRVGARFCIINVACAMGRQIHMSFLARIDLVFSERMLAIVDSPAITVQLSLHRVRPRPAQTEGPHLATGWGESQQSSLAF
jgi:hypothetical protein